MEDNAPLIVAAAALAAAVACAAGLIYRRRQQKTRYRQQHTVYQNLSPDQLVEDEQAVAQKVKDGIDFFHSAAKRGTVVGRDGLNIHFAELCPENNNGSSCCTLFYIPGWTECMAKYGDLFQEFVQQHNIRVVVIDLRSQGYSDRVPITKSQHKLNHLKSHVVDFHDYVTDCLLVINRTVDLQATKLFIAGFSMGGLVANELNKLIPSSGLIMLAPCLHPPIPLVSRRVARFVASKLRSDEFMLGHPVFLDHKLLRPPLNRGSQSLARVLGWEEQRSDSSILVTGMSWSHLHCLLTPDVMEDHRALLTRRILVMSAQYEHLVSNEAIYEYCEAKRQEVDVCRHVHFNQSKHGLLWEIEPIRDRAVQEMVNFMLW